MNVQPKAPNISRLGEIVNKIVNNTVNQNDAYELASNVVWMQSYLNALSVPPPNQCADLNTLASLPLKFFSTPVYAVDSYAKYTKAASDFIYANRNPQSTFLPEQEFEQMQKALLDLYPAFAQADPNRFEGNVGRNIAEIMRMVDEYSEVNQNLTAQMSELKASNENLERERNILIGRVKLAENRATEAENRETALSTLLQGLKQDL